MGTEELAWEAYLEKLKVHLEQQLAPTILQKKEMVETHRMRPRIAFVNPNTISTEPTKFRANPFHSV